MKPERLAPIKKAVDLVTPPGWRTRLTTRGNYVVLTIQAAPVDLLALDRVAHPDDERVRPYAKINPLPYETPWDDASAAIIAIWRALHTGCAVEFDRSDNRIGEFHFVELWIGSLGKPFALQSE